MQEIAAALVIAAGLIVSLTIIFPTYLRILKHFIEGARQKNSFNAILTTAKILEDFFAATAKSKQENTLDLRQELRDAKSELEENKESLNLLLNEGLSDISGEITRDWRKAVFASRNRLNTESKRLMERSTVNLSLGLAFSGVSVITLILTLFLIPSESNYEDTTAFLVFFLPRLTITLLIQAVAAFFLKMHASNEKDIERNKNQITNLELQFVAVQISEDADCLQETAKELCSARGVSQQA